MENMRYIGKQMTGYVCLILVMLTVMTACADKNVDGRIGAENNTLVETGLKEAGSAELDSAEPGSEDSEGLDDAVPVEAAMVIHITINPELNLFVDESGTVLTVEHINKDAEDAFSDMDLTGIDMGEAVKQVVSTALDKGYLKDGKQITVEVEKQNAAELETISATLPELIAASVQEALKQEEMTIQLVLTVEGEKQPVIEIKPETDTIDETGTLNAERMPLESQPENMQSSETQLSEQQATELKVSDSCKTCGGTGRCDECQGDGYRGTGYAVSCPRCHGSLTETCIYCDASGNSNKHEGTCDFPRCMGSHIYACTICNGGTSPAVCQSCGGSGNCSACGGTGER